MTTFGLILNATGIAAIVFVIWIAIRAKQHGNPWDEDE